MNNENHVGHPVMLRRSIRKTGLKTRARLVAKEIIFFWILIKVQYSMAIFYCIIVDKQF